MVWPSSAFAVAGFQFVGWRGGGGGKMEWKMEATEEYIAALVGMHILSSIPDLPPVSLGMLSEGAWSKCSDVPRVFLMLGFKGGREEELITG